MFINAFSFVILILLTFVWKVCYSVNVLKELLRMMSLYMCKNCRALVRVIINIHLTHVNKSKAVVVCHLLYYKCYIVRIM